MPGGEDYILEVKYNMATHAIASCLQRLLCPEEAILFEQCLPISL